MRLVILALLLPAVSGQTCANGQTCADAASTGPCGAGGLCAPNETCITDTPDKIFVCCPLASVISSTSTTAKPSASGSCADLPNQKTGTSDCPNVKNLCNDPIYQPLMKQQCPKTCGFCSTTGGNTTPSGGCKDLPNQQTGTSDCPGLQYLCNDSVYKEMMKQQCPKTCGYCT